MFIEELFAQLKQFFLSRGWRRCLKFWLPVLFVLSLFIPNYYYSPEMVARVVGGDGKPVAGAIIVVSWNMNRGWTNYPLGSLAVAEAVTDAQGWFRVPAWGPLQSDDSMNVTQPVVRIFKPGFTPLIVDNVEGVGMTSANSIIRFRFQHQTLTLQRYSGVPAAYEKELDSLVTSLNAIYVHSPQHKCYWRDTYRILLALENEKVKLVQHGAGQMLPVATQYAGLSCADAQRFFQEKRRLDQTGEVREFIPAMDQ